MTRTRFKEKLDILGIDLRIADLIDGEYIFRAEPVPISKQKIVSEVFARLEAAGARLLAVIAHNKGGTNKDLAKFADQINSLCDKWDR